ncbi:MAG: hypothetical protein JSW00_18145 [Thermoplasmata archaeon]|nr:MAG: hypothetical protein JSW00_18145 [Thermoplasmata archaeon]
MPGPEIIKKGRKDGQIPQMTSQEWEIFKNEALREPEISEAIKRGVEKGDFSQESFDLSIENRKDVFTEACDSYYRKYIVNKKLLSERKAELLNVKPPHSSFIFLFDLLKTAIIIAGIIFITGFLLSTILSGFSPTIEWFIRYPGFVIFGIYIIIVIQFLIANQLFRKKYVREKEQFQEDMRRELKIDIISENVDGTRKEIINEGIKPEIRIIIDDLSEPSYEVTMESRKTDKLTEVFNPKYITPRESISQLEKKIDGMEGAAIGISGPRGSGKSTLIRKICKGDVAKDVEDLDNKVLRLMTSAPIDYDARDFILHIFKKICQKALLLEYLKSPIEIRKLAKQTREKIFHHFQELIGEVEIPSELRRDLQIHTRYYPLTQTTMRVFMLITLTLTAVLLTSTYLSGDIISFELLQIPSWIYFISIPYLVLFILTYYYIKKSSMRTKVGNEIMDKAIENIDNIKYQLSYTSGWSGSLKLPMGVDIGEHKAISYSVNQRSVPDIIDDYRNFITLLTQNKYKVIIGIDEMDKISPPEKAENFLNDIKALFHLYNCYYLISVSESAATRFEQRGLPFRDTFDSSFNEIIEVNYLNFEEAKNLLKRRVIGTPIPFSALNYCMSGGLARDYIRKCRDSYELIEKEPKTLSTVTFELVKKDLEKKLEAIFKSYKSQDVSGAYKHENADQKIMPLPKSLDETQLLHDILMLQRKLKLKDNWKSLLDLLNRTDCGLGCGIKMEEDFERDDIKSVKREELETYLYYSKTLLEFFNEERNKGNLINTLKKAEGKKRLNELAKARQLIGNSPIIARESIDLFRDLEETKGIFQNHQ